MRKISVVILLFVLSFYSNCSGQDTIRIITYNLLNFSNSGCTPSVSNRYDTLKKIMEYLKPDILLVNELENLSASNQILSNSLNVNGITHYQKANFVVNQSSGANYLNNMMFYNANKISLKSQNVILTDIRDISRYYVYHKSPNLNTYQDTLFLSFYLAHLKAGSTQPDLDDRTAMCDSVRKYIDNLPTNDYNIFAGDCNIQASSEASFQRLITGGTRPFRDPIDLLGTWNNNYSLRHSHTQSTRSNEIYDCGITGGLDDRFDLILFSDNIMNGGNRVQFLQNSYAAVGNDGNHLNLSIKAGNNNSVPNTIASALLNRSDHLPVISRVVLYYQPLIPPAFSSTSTTSPLNTKDNLNSSFLYPNPAKDKLHFKFPTNLDGLKKIEIVSSYGSIVANYLSDEPINDISLPISKLGSGMYLVRIKMKEGEYTNRFIKE